MPFRQAVGQTTYAFADLKELMAKATPPRSGDRLAGIAAETAEENVAAKMALADVPLKRILAEPLIPYEQDEVTRLILDTHDAKAICAHRGHDGRRAFAISCCRTGQRPRCWPRWRRPLRRRWPRRSPRSCATRT